MYLTFLVDGRENLFGRLEGHGVEFGTAFGRAEYFESGFLKLADTLAGEPVLIAELLEGGGGPPVERVAADENATADVGQIINEPGAPAVEQSLEEGLQILGAEADDPAFAQTASDKGGAEQLAGPVDLVQKVVNAVKLIGIQANSPRLAHGCRG
jgi:hypothetical protein